MPEDLPRTLCIFRRMSVNDKELFFSFLNGLIFKVRFWIWQVFHPLCNVVHHSTFHQFIYSVYFVGRVNYIITIVHTDLIWYIVVLLVVSEFLWTIGNTSGSNAASQMELMTIPFRFVLLTFFHARHWWWHHLLGEGGMRGRSE